MRISAALTAAVSLMYVASASAMVIDASCVGVQAVATRQLISQLAVPAREQFEPVAQHVGELEQRMTQVIAEPDRQLRRVQQEIAQRMPGATDEQRRQALFSDILTVEATDRVMQQAAVAQVDAHIIEGRLMVAASRVPRSGHRERLVEVVRRYADLQPSGVSSGRDVEGMQQAFGAAAVGRALQGLSMLEGSSQTLASDIAQLGFDTAGVAAEAPVDAVQILPRVIAVGVAQGAQSQLILEHITAHSAPADVRRQITQPRATETGRTHSTQIAQALNGLARSDRILRIAARSAPPPPPPEPPRSPERRQWLTQAVARVEEVVAEIIEDGPPILLEEAGIESPQARPVP